MRINEVEQLVDITKKNIRFYEQQGLLNPARNENNRYREYSEEDVDMLCRIKLLRRLAVPISEIRRLQEMNIPLEDCMRRHMITLEREAKNLEKIREMCSELAERGGRLFYSGCKGLPSGNGVYGKRRRCIRGCKTYGQKNEKNRCVAVGSSCRDFYGIAHRPVCLVHLGH